MSATHEKTISSTGSALSESSSRSYRIQTESSGEHEMTEQEVSSLVKDAVRQARRSSKRRVARAASTGSPAKPSPNRPLPPITPTGLIIATSSAPELGQPLDMNSPSMSDMDALLAPTYESGSFRGSSVGASSFNAADDIIRKVEMEIASARKAASEAHARLQNVMNISWDNPRESLSSDVNDSLSDHLGDADLRDILSVSSVEESADGYMKASYPKAGANTTVQSALPRFLKNDGLARNMSESSTGRGSEEKEPSDATSKERKEPEETEAGETSRKDVAEAKEETVLDVKPSTEGSLNIEIAQSAFEDGVEVPLDEVIPTLGLETSPVSNKADPPTGRSEDSFSLTRSGEAVSASTPASSDLDAPVEVDTGLMIAISEIGEHLSPGRDPSAEDDYSEYTEETVSDANSEYTEETVEDDEDESPNVIPSEEAEQLASVSQNEDHGTKNESVEARSTPDPEVVPTTAPESAPENAPESSMPDPQPVPEMAPTKTLESRPESPKPWWAVGWLGGDKEEAKHGTEPADAPASSVTEITATVAILPPSANDTPVEVESPDNVILCCDRTGSGEVGVCVTSGGVNEQGESPVMGYEVLSKAVEAGPFNGVVEEGNAGKTEETVSAKSSEDIGEEGSTEAEESDDAEHVHQSPSQSEEPEEEVTPNYSEGAETGGTKDVEETTSENPWFTGGVDVLPRSTEAQDGATNFSEENEAAVEMHAAATPEAAESTALREIVINAGDTDFVEKPEAERKRVQFRYPYPVPPQPPKPRSASEILKENTMGKPERVARWTQPKPELQELLLAVKGDSLARRSNACGALKVLLSGQAKNLFVLVRTVGFLEALVFACNADIPSSDWETAVAARSRAVTTILKVSEPKENRVLVMTEPGLPECLVKVIKEDCGEARVQACGALAMLAKTPVNRESMVKVPDLVKALAQVVNDTIDPEELLSFDEEKGHDEESDVEASPSAVGSSSFSSADGSTADDEGLSLDVSSSVSSPARSPNILRKLYKPDSIRQQKDGKQDEYWMQSKLNACAVLLHLSKHCAVSDKLCADLTLMDSLMTVSRDFDSPLHTKCLEILCNLTRFPANNGEMARDDVLVDTLAKCGKSKKLEDRVWALRALQNIASDSTSKNILASSRILTLLSICAMRKDLEEQGAAVAALYNLSTEPGAVVPLTNTRNVVATLVHLAHNAQTPPETRRMSCEALATIGLWLQTLAGTGTVPHDVQGGLLPTHKTTGWQRWD